MTRNGRNVLRDISNLTQRNNATQEISNATRFGDAPTLQKAVVIDVIIDPNLLTEDRIEQIRNTINNPRFVDVMPTNSIIARITSNAQGQIAGTNTILFPFFSSHFMLPVQPGEIVQVIYDDYMGSGNAIGYWLTRTASERTIEDVNYTHLDRRFEPSLNPGAYSTSEKNDRKEEQPPIGFPNGGDNKQTHTLAVSDENKQPYEKIITNATSYLNETQGIENFESDGETPLITPEPVPRWRKRPQEFVLQGANNTLICLGEDRKGGPFGALVDEEPDAKNQAGTVDIVVGRGRYPATNPSSNPRDQTSDVNKAPTSPIITENSRGFLETDKAPYRKMAGEKRLKDNPIEGDPDFSLDAARLYVSMQTEADKNFGLTNIEYTDDTTPITQPNEGNNGSINKSYIVGKADHIRMIARSDLAEDNPRGIDGTIAIIREGISEDEENSLGVIYINKTGIQIDSTRINLGRGLADIAGADGDPTPGGEPYIRWSKFRDTVKRLQVEMDTIRTSLEAQVDKVAQELQNTRKALATAFLTTSCVPFSPDPALISAATQLEAASAEKPTGKPVMAGLGGPGSGASPKDLLSTQRKDLDSDLDSKRSDTTNDVDAAASTKIFGE